MLNYCSTSRGHSRTQYHILLNVERIGDTNVVRTLRLNTLRVQYTIAYRYAHAHTHNKY